MFYWYTLYNVVLVHPVQCCIGIPCTMFYWYTLYNVLLVHPVQCCIGTPCTMFYWYTLYIVVRRNLCTISLKKIIAACNRWLHFYSFQEIKSGKPLNDEFLPFNPRALCSSILTFILTFTDIYWGLLGFTEFTEVYWGLLGFTEVY